MYDPLLESGLFDAGSLEASVDHTALHLKRRRLEGLRLADGNGGGHYELGVQATLPPRPLEYRFLEEENSLLRKRVEELKKQVKMTKGWGGWILGKLLHDGLYIYISGNSVSLLYHSA